MKKQRNLNLCDGFKESVATHGGCYSFINFASIDAYFRNVEFVRIKYFADGILAAKLFSFLSGQKIERVSFDFTSAAKNVFEMAEKDGLSLYLIGANDIEINKFIVKIKKRHAKIKIADAESGYINTDIKNKAEIICKTSPDVVVIGMGAGKQEQLALALMDAGYNGLIFTCGGFIRQEAGCDGDYYPNYINKFNLRWLYRMYKEPHTIKRYIVIYPINLTKFIYNAFNKSIKININNIC